MTEQPKSYKYTATCQNKLCLSQFGTNRKHTKTCSPKCRQVVSRQREDKQDKKRLRKFTTSAFAHYLADQCKRAGTLEIIPKKIGQLVELCEVYKYSLRANGYGHSRRFSICHIQPVKSATHIGTLFPQNIVVSTTADNVQFKNKSHAGFGHRILKARLSPSLRIDEKLSNGKVIKELVSYLGEAVVCELAVKCKLQSSQKQQLIDWLRAQNDSRVPKLVELMELPPRDLVNLKALISGKKGFSKDFSTYSTEDVFLHELQRQTAHRPDLIEVREYYLAKLQPVRALEFGLSLSGIIGIPRTTETTTLTSNLHKAQFELLHGGSPANLFYALKQIGHFMAERDAGNSKGGNARTLAVIEFQQPLLGEKVVTLSSHFEEDTPPF